MAGRRFGGFGRNYVKIKKTRMTRRMTRGLRTDKIIRDILAL